MMPLLLTWQENMVCQVILGTILIQNRNFRDISGLVDSLGAKMTLRVKFRDVNGNYADVLWLTNVRCLLGWHYLEPSPGLRVSSTIDVGGDTHNRAWRSCWLVKTLLCIVLLYIYIQYISRCIVKIIQLKIPKQTYKLEWGSNYCVLQGHPW